MQMPKSRKTEPYITRWTKEQKRELRKAAYKLGLSMNEFIERKVFNIPLESHPAKLED
jgi:hypothetical protein